MARKKLKIAGKVAFAVVTALAALLFAACSGSGKKENEVSKTNELVVVVPADSGLIISSLISEYEKEHSEASVKLIKMSGSSEEIYRFCVSVLIDSKFNADMLIIDDVWLDAFAKEGLVCEIDGVKDYDFIRAAENAMVFNGKVYGVPIYADLMAEFKKYNSQSETTVCLQESASDALAFIRSQIGEGLSLDDAYDRYKSISKCSNVSEFVDSDAKTMKAWLSNLNVLQKYYPKAAVNMKIGLSDKALIKTKLAIINSKSKSKTQATDIIKYLLADKAQNEIVSNMPGVPVMSKHYSDLFIQDKIPYIKSINGENFCTFPFSANFENDEKKAQEMIESGASDGELKKALLYMEK